MHPTAEKSLVNLLRHESQLVRMKALHLLCESYSRSDLLFDNVLDGWERWDAEEAYPEFAMLSHFPVPAQRIEQCASVAAKMAVGRALTDKSSRCAGKLMEQLVRLSPRELQPHLATIESTLGQSKIFFRVSPAHVRQRIALLEKSADELAEQLNQSLAELAGDGRQSTSEQNGLDALEALQLYHPNYIDLGSAIKRAPEDGSAGVGGFRLSILSLIERPQSGLEERLAVHLIDRREAIYTAAVEALVSLGTAGAAAHLLNAFPDAPEANRAWIARGLQRIRSVGLAEEISNLRARVADPQLWLMLLIAEIHQLDPFSLQNTPADIDRVLSASEALSDALFVYVQVHRQTEHNDSLAKGDTMYDSYSKYLERYQERIRQTVESQTAQTKPAVSKTEQLKQRRKQVLQAIKKRRKQ